MLTKLLTNQIELFQDVIKETIEKSIPHYDEETKTKLFQDIMLEEVQVWLSELDEKFDGILITQLRDEISIGVKTLTCIAVYAPNGTEYRSFKEGFVSLVKFAKLNNCKRVDFYSSNPELIKYARMFNVVWETTYFQLALE